MCLYYKRETEGGCNGSNYQVWQDVLHVEWDVLYGDNDQMIKVFETGVVTLKNQTNVVLSRKTHISFSSKSVN